MIQDIQPHDYQNTYRPVPPEPGDFLLIYEGRKALLKKDGAEIRFPRFEEVEQGLKDGESEKPCLYEKYVYLFSIDEKRYYLGKPEYAEYLQPAGFGWEDIWLFRSAAPKETRFAGITGWQLSRWYESRRYCGRCGNRMEPDEKERMMRCPECGLMEFPKICPAVIIGVTDGNRILMSKYAGREFKKYALLAGFNEIGESIEETVKREVMEEVGLHVKNITYYKSQPWSFSDTLLMGFF